MPLDALSPPRPPTQDHLSQHPGAGRGHQPVREHAVPRGAPGHHQPRARGLRERRLHVRRGHRQVLPPPLLPGLRLQEAGAAGEGRGVAGPCQCCAAVWGWAVPCLAPGCWGCEGGGRGGPGGVGQCCRCQEDGSVPHSAVPAWCHAVPWSVSPWRVAQQEHSIHRALFWGWGDGSGSAWPGASGDIPTAGSGVPAGGAAVEEPPQLLPLPACWRRRGFGDSHPACCRGCQLS